MIYLLKDEEIHDLDNQVMCIPRYKELWNLSSRTASEIQEMVLIDARLKTKAQAFKMWAELKKKYGSEYVDEKDDMFYQILIPLEDCEQIEKELKP